MKNFILNIKEWILNYRLIFLFLTSALGLCILCGIQTDYYLHNISKIKNEKLVANIQILLISLPTLTLLWYFRTYDTREQIEKSQENIQTSILTKAMDMITDENTDKKALGLLLLLKIKKDNEKNTHLLNTIKIAINNTNLSGAKYDKYTKFPEGFDPKERGMIYIS